VGLEGQPLRAGFLTLDGFYRRSAMRENDCLGRNRAAGDQDAQAAWMTRKATRQQRLGGWSAEDTAGPLSLGSGGRFFFIVDD
jgi:hypothetical protein